MTRTTINHLLWGTSMAAQLALFALALRRGVGRVLPLFTGLLGFYPARALALFLLFGHMATARYADMYRAVALAGLVAEFAVAVELGVKLSTGLWMMRAAAVSLICLLACGVVVLLLRWAPANAPIPPDRLQMLCSAMLVLLAVQALAVPKRPLVRWVAQGFGVYGAVDLVAVVERASATVHRDARSFAGWSYGVSAAYLAAVLVWIWAVSRKESTSRRRHA